MRWSSRGGSNLGVDIAADRRPVAQAVSAEKLARLRKVLAGLGLHVGDVDPSVDLNAFLDVLIACAETRGRAVDPDYESNTDVTAASEGVAPVSMSLNHPHPARPSREQTENILAWHEYNMGRGPRPGA